MKVPAEDAEGRKKFAGYRLRAPMSLEKMTYDAATGTVIYRSKMHAGLKRNFQVMPGVEWLALLCEHIPDRDEPLVRSYHSPLAPSDCPTPLEDSRRLASTGIAIGRAQVQYALGARLGGAKSAECHRDSRAREKRQE